MAKYNLSNNDYIKLYGVLTSAVAKPIVKADAVYDSTLDKTQDEINQIAVSGSSALVDITNYLNSGTVLPKAAAYTNGDRPCVLSATTEGADHSDHTLFILSCEGQMSASNGISGKTVYVFNGDENSDGWVYSNTVEFSDEASYRSNTDILKAFGLILPEATTTFSGLMSKEDKAKLDSMSVSDGTHLTNSQISYDASLGYKLTNTLASGSTSNGGNIPVATSTVPGILSAADKAKLDKISLTATGQIETTCVESMTYDASTRQFKLVNANDSTVTSTALPLATSTVAGLMSAEDKAKLDAAAGEDYGIDNIVVDQDAAGAKIIITDNSSAEHEAIIPLATSDKNGLLKKERSEDVDALNGLAAAIREAIGVGGDMAVGRVSLLPGSGLSLATDPYSDNEQDGCMHVVSENTGEQIYYDDTYKKWVFANDYQKGCSSDIPYAVANKNGGVITKTDKAALDNVANLKLVFKDGQLALTDGTNDYLIDAYSKIPATPGLTTSQTYELIKGGKATITFTNKDSKTCTLTIDGVDSGQAATASVEPGKTITRTITCTAENESARYGVSVKATRNDQTSAPASAEYIIKRKVNTPVVTVSGDKYDKSRTITASTTTSGSTIQYSTGSSYTDMPAGGITITSDTLSRAYGFKGIQSAWVDSDNTYTDAIQVGKLPVYVGFGAATLANEAAITSMEGVQKVKKDSPAGTYNVTNTTTGKYFWICSAGTVSKVTSSGFGVPMNAVATVDGYKCYRTASAVMITGTQEFTVA